MEKKKTLLLDVEEVICFGGFLQAVNDFLGTNYEIDDFTDYYIDEVAIPKDRSEEFNKFLRNRNLFENPQMIPYAIEVIKELCEVYDVYICSSCINPFDLDGSAKIFIDKFYFLRKYLPFISPDHFIFTSMKHLFNADIQIDDLLSKMNGDIGLKILFPSYHNKDVTDEKLAQAGAVRAGYDWREGWLEVKKLLLTNK